MCVKMQRNNHFKNQTIGKIILLLILSFKSLVEKICRLMCSAVKVSTTTTNYLFDNVYQNAWRSFQF